MRKEVAKIWSYLLGEKEPNGSTSYGSARFSSSLEERILLAQNTGVLLDGKRKRLSKEDSFKHALILGVTGSGKSSTIVLPNLLAPVRKTSYVVIDLSKELYSKSSGYLRKKGFDVKVVDCSLTNRIAESETYNPIAFINSPFDSHIRRLSRIIMDTAKLNVGDPFWSLNARQIIEIIVKFLKTQGEEKQTLYEVYRIANAILSDKESVQQLFMQHLPDEIYQEFLAIMSYSDKLLSSVISTVRAALQYVSDHSVQDLTASNSLGDIAKDLRARPSVLYLCVPEDEVSDASILTMLLSDLFHGLNEMPTKSDMNISILLDEFSNLIRIPDASTYFTVFRKRRVSLIAFIQSLEQLYANYGKSGQIIFDNTYTKVVLPAVSVKDAEVFSKACGQSTMLTEEEERYISRPLMYSDEVSRIEPNTALVLCGNNYPMKLTTRPWFKSFFLRWKVRKYEIKLKQ